MGGLILINDGVPVFVDTSVDAARRSACATQVKMGLPARVGAGPQVVSGVGSQARTDGIIFDVRKDSIEFGLVANPMVVVFLLPKRLAGAAEETIRLASGRTFKRTHEFCGINQWEQENVDVIAHQGKSSHAEVHEFEPGEDRFNDNLSDGRIAEVHGACAGGIEVAIYAGEGFARSNFAGRGKAIGGQASMQMKGDKQPATVGIGMRKPSSSHTIWWAMRRKILVDTSVDAARKSACATRVGRVEVVGELMSTIDRLGCVSKDSMRGSR